jgi:hypothetical protein
MVAMKISNISFVCSLVLLFLFGPQVSSAYFTTSQSAMQINADTMLYTITYEFGSDIYDMYLPIVAVEEGTTTEYEKTVGYRFVDKVTGLEIKSDSVQALVLSDTGIVGNEYKLERGVAKILTLVALVKLSPPTQGEKYEVAMQMTSLPFRVVAVNGETGQTQLNSSELKSYKTTGLTIR